MSDYQSLPRSYTYTPANISLTGFASAVTGASWPLTATNSGDSLAHKVTVQNNSANTKAAINIVIVGLDGNGNAQTETLTGPAGNATVTSAKYYSSLTSVTPASTWGADTANIGWAGSFASGWINVNYLAEDILSLVADVTGTINFTLNQTFDRYDEPGVTARWFAVASSQTADGIFQTTGGATAVQFIANSYSNSASVILNANATFVANVANSGGAVDTNVNVAQWGGTATTLGQKLMAASVPVAIALDQSAVPTSNATQLPASLGQKTMAASLPSVLASDQMTTGSPSTGGSALPTKDIIYDSSGTALTYNANGQAISSSSAPVVPASDYFPAGFTYKHVGAGQATTVVKASAGVLHSITFNSAATATNVTTVYDNASGSGTVIAIPAATTATIPMTLVFDVVFSLGLTIITTTANGADMTISYR